MADPDPTEHENSDSVPSPESLEPNSGIDSNSSDPRDESVSLESKSETINQDISPNPSKKPTRLKRIRQSVNIYLLLLGAVVVMAAIVIVLAYVQGHHSTNSNSLKTQNLTQATLNQLAQSNSTLGNSQYVLTVESSAIFAGQVIVRQNLEVAGDLQVGGTAAFNNISVAGTGQFSQATVSNNLTVGGNNAIQGSETIAKSLQVNNGGSFGGPLSAPQVTTTTLQLNGNLVLQHHISVSGATPSRSGGTALGEGGSVSISGTDIAGSISINTGSSPPAGCFVSISFTTPYNATPHVLVTPIGSAAGGLSYYVNRSTTSFSICDTSTPPASSSFGFDYFVVD